MTGETWPLVSTPVDWMDAEPARLERDCVDMATFAPDAEFIPPPTGAHGASVHHGLWTGVLPVWPFERAEPVGLRELTKDNGLRFVLYYTAAYPMVPPLVYACGPEPELEERTQNRWHVAPGGSLCLLQSNGAWIPESSIVELLLKAAGWRIEYALMKAGLVDSMLTNGMVSDSSRDHLLAEAATGGKANQENGQTQ